MKRSFPGATRLSFAWLSIAVCLFIIAPIIFLFLSWQNVDFEIWVHLASTQLAELLSNTLVLCVGVVVGVSFLGTSLAWLTSVFRFPGVKVFEWALALPLAMPAYVIAFVFVATLDYAGPLQSTIRTIWGSSDFFPEVRNSGGVICCFVLVLYPYTYLLARSAFVTQSHHLYESALSLGVKPSGIFFRLALPLARPAIIAGTMLALMETLADFGAVSIFNYDTFTTAIYKSWYGFFSLNTAAQLATGLFVVVLFLWFIEKKLLGKTSHQEIASPQSSRRLKLSGWRAYIATAFCGFILTISFILPMLQLILWACKYIVEAFDARFLSLLIQSLSLGAISAALVVFIALFLAYVRRFDQRPWVKFSVRISTIGYVLPGSILAVGVMLWLNWLDGFLVAKVSWLPGQQFLVGTLVALLIAYCVRFMAVAFGPIYTSLQRIKPNLSEASRSMGVGQFQFVRRVLLPLLAPGILSAALLVFVDVMKEMPATLLLRPFGWDTLAVKIYEYTSEGEWQHAALPGLALVILGLLPVFIMIKRSGIGQTDR